MAPHSTQQEIEEIEKHGAVLESAASKTIQPRCDLLSALESSDAEKGASKTPEEC